jgi:hypothetical protein
MYYPDANVLVPADTGPDSKTPALKAVTVEVEAHRALELVG